MSCTTDTYTANYTLGVPTAAYTLSDFTAGYCFDDAAEWLLTELGEPVLTEDSIIVYFE